MFTASPNPPTMRVAIYRASSIGDVVLATSCLTLLKRLQLPTQIYWLGRQPSLGLIASAYPELIPVEVHASEPSTGQDSIAALVNDTHLIVDLQKNIRSHLVCTNVGRASGAPVFTWQKDGLRRSGLIMRGRVLGRSRKLDASKLQPKVLQYQMMLAAMRNALVTHLPVELRDGIQHDAPPCLPTTHDDGDRPWQKELRFGKWIAVAPGAAHATKQAPVSIVAEILEHLRFKLQSGETGVGLVFLGDEHDRKTSLELIDRISWPYATLNLAGKLSLWESALALKEARVLLTNDSSLCHIAEAVNTPTATMFGPTIELFGFSPRMAESRAFSSLLGCRPCSKHGRAPCRYGDHKCFYNLNTNEIADFVHERVY